MMRAQVVATPSNKSSRSTGGTRPLLVAAQMLMVIALISCASSRPPSPVCAVGAHLDDRGRCHAQAPQTYKIPFREGHQARVTQAFHGFETHHEELAYAVDFACEPGTPITAARDGVVWSIRKDSNTSCPDESCINDANYVVVDHGDGTYAAYFHLQHQGVVVEPGDQVCRGQLLGLCGDTGFATAPHLHFSVLGPNWSTLPMRFEEVSHRGVDILLPRETYQSENRRTFGCRPTEFSTLGHDAFIHRGIVLRRPLPLVLRGDGERTMRVEGRYVGDEPYVAIHRRPSGQSNWINQCVPVDEWGRFAFEIDWPQRIFDQGYFFLMLTGSDEDCRAPGWGWSYRVHIF